MQAREPKPERSGSTGRPSFGVGPIARVQARLMSVLPNPPLPVEDGPAVLELDRKSGRGQSRARERKPERGAGDVERPVHRVPSIRSHSSGGPKRTYRASPAIVAQVTRR